MKNVSILLPSKQKRYLYQHLIHKKHDNDEIMVFNAGMHQITSVMNKRISESKHDYIILLDPKKKDFDINNIKKVIPDYYYDNIKGVIGFSKNDFVKVQSKCLSHIKYQEKVLKSLKTYKEVLTKPIKWNKISIIIPFMYNGDRINLFNICIENLYNLIKNDSNIELVIHETGPEQYLTNDWIKKYNIKYEFSKWNYVFHRGWSLNYAAKHISTGDLYVFMDADLIVDKQWINSIKNVSGVSIGWSEMINLNYNGTQKFINKKWNIQNSDIERIRKPNAYAAAGGINIYPKKVFYDIKGWCEDYYGTYGGEDNSTFLKLHNFNIPVHTINSKVFHLYHAHNTFKHPKRFEIFNKHKEYTKSNWMKYINNIKSWGDKEYKISDTEKSLKILWLKIDTSKRVAGHYDDLPNELSNHCHIDILTCDLQNQHPAIFQQRCLINDIQRPEIVKDHILKSNNNYDFIICANLFAFNNEDWSKINIPKAVLIEDQHGENNLNQIKLAKKDNWIVLHRYQFNKFHTDLNKKLNCIWFPHSVNIKKFKNYKQQKKYDILQTGALYNVYETRNFINNIFKYDPNFHHIQRPKENEDKQWPTGIDYSKELNKSLLSICCGSIYQYPVMKYFEIPASHSIIFGDWFPELGDLGFEPYKNMIVVDKENIKLQIKLLKENINKLTKIANNGYNLIHERHTNQIRAKELINIIKNILKKGDL